MTRRTVHIAAATSVVMALAAGAAAAQGSPSAVDSTPFARTATYPVYQNVPAGVDPAQETVAEISTVSKDGRTLVYTDAAGKRIGFLDLSNPNAPMGTGTVSMAELGDAEAEPTSVHVVGGYVLVVVNTSPSYTEPSGKLVIVRLSDRAVVRTIDLGGQPDSIDVSADEKHAIIAIENERDEDVNDGDLPQAPAGFLQVIDLPTTDPASWTATKVALTTAAGDPIPVLAAAGLDTPSDPEPEYVAINRRGIAAVTLQENNGIVLVDLARKSVTKAWSAGTVTRKGVDTVEDGIFDFTGSFTAPREPDSIAWVDDRYVATANEGDWKGGSRGWTVFDSSTKGIAWDSGITLEMLAATYGLHNEDRSENKGTEPEGLAIAEMGGKRYAFVASERSNFVAVYDISNPKAPKFRQMLATTNGPEGVLPIPSRGILAVSSEVDDADAQVRSSVNLYKLGGADNPVEFATIVSGRDATNKPIGWGALSGLSALPWDTNRLAAVSDSAYATGRIYFVNAAKRPALITSVMTVTDEAGAPIGLDLEGISARKNGGFWLGVEGATGAANQLVRTDSAGRIQQRVNLPAEVTSHIGKWGVEGVSAIGTGAQETVYVALQRPLWTDPKAATGPIDGEGVVRIGRYQVSTGTWSWFGYQLESTTASGDWMGISEVTALDADTVAVIERDKRNGPNAQVKRVYAVDVPAQGAPEVDLPILSKRLVVDVLPTLRATRGWTQEKFEGFTVTANGQMYAVTDNDGLKDATGETVFMRLGALPTGARD
mgnify:CR=1 FL=1